MNPEVIPRLFLEYLRKRGEIGGIGIWRGSGFYVIISGLSAVLLRKPDVIRSLQLSQNDTL